jgi:hypothetical protein
MTAFITENPALAIGVWSLILLLVGFAFGYRSGKEQSAPEGDRGRLDRPPPSMPSAPAMPAAPLPGLAAAGPSTLSSEALARIRDALGAGNKIQAIKIMREETGLGLAEAKHAVEAMER